MMSASADLFLQNSRTLRIGEVAAHTGLTPRTIRYYEQIGLLPDATERAKGKHRHYDVDDLEQLELIAGLRDLLGLSLDEISELVAAGGTWFAPHRPWETSASMVERSAVVDAALAQVDLQLASVRSRAADLEALEQRLRARRLAIESKRLT
jgi:DNA-binding transcriptional MerR regulator